MTNYNGVKVFARHDRYVVKSHDQWYYFDAEGKLVGPYETMELALQALRTAWEQYDA